MGESAVKTVDLARIGEVVSDSMGINKTKIYGKSRIMDVALARQLAMYLSRETTNNSLGGIGKHFGGRDHSTVIHACKIIEEKLKKDGHLSKIVDEIKSKLE